MNFQDKKITIMGLGTFGGAIAATKFLAERGAIVTVTDLASEEELQQSLAALDDVSLHAVHLNGHVEEDFTEADIVLVNPAVQRDNYFVQLAKQAGSRLTSEMNLFWQLNRGKIVGVTGSNGKSTTAAMIHSIVSASEHRCYLGGNIGYSLLDVVEEIEPEEIVILELSSFQLEDISHLMGSPCISVVTNFSPNHLDWHGSTDAYRKAKQTIFNWQCPEGIAIRPANHDDVASWNTYGRTLCFGQDDSSDGVFFTEKGDALIRHAGKEKIILLSNWLQVRGDHNVQNALAAICTAVALDIPLEIIEQGIKTFLPLPHRLQFVGKKNEIQFYNDSLATTPESAIAALNSFDEPLLLIAGGYDKQVDLDAFTNEMIQKCKAVALIGETALEMSEALDRHSFHQYQTCETLAEAFAKLVDQASAGDVVLLSPGCASYGMFLNFAERGEMFIELVEGI